MTACSVGAIAAVSMVGIALGGCAGARPDPGSSRNPGTTPGLAMRANSRESLSVADGVYAEAQSRRGEIAYMKDCRRCHQRDLKGDFVEDAPPLVGEDFLAEWSRWTVGDLFEFLTTEMPPKPKERLEVSMQSYADIIAFILEKNDYPAGAGELPADFEMLSQIEMRP